MNNIDLKKLIIPNIPYLLFVWLFDKAAQAFRLSPGADLSEKLLSQMKKQADRPPHGKQTLKQLMKQNAGVSNIEITGENIKAFESTAKKYHIDFALKKDTTETPPRYLVFFKGRDADVLTAAFQEFSAKKLTQDKKPSIRKLLSDFRQKAAALNVQREQVKNKDRGRER